MHYLNLDSHYEEGFYQIKLFPSLVRKITNICLVSVLRSKNGFFKKPCKFYKCKFCFLERHTDLCQVATFRFNDY